MFGKRELREAVLAARSAIAGGLRTVDDQAIARAATGLVRDHRRVAAYVPLPDEPGGAFLLPALAAVAELLLPVHRPDNDLDWARYDGGLAPGEALTRLREPTGPRLGPAAIATATIVLVPALAVDPEGVRLGRGGGSYDRALARLPDGVPVVALLYRDEVLPALPREPHDRRVSLVLDPNGLTSVGPRP